MALGLGSLAFGFHRTPQPKTKGLRPKAKDHTRMRALMTLEGIAILTDPGFSFFETAKPYAREFMLRREGKMFRKLILDKLSGREDGNGRIAWSRVWKLTKMAAQMYLEK